jgi:hypothetical protein
MSTPPRDPRDPAVRIKSTGAETAQSIAAAYEANCIERAKAGVPLLPPPTCVPPSMFYRPDDPTLEQHAMLDATDGIYRQILEHGLPTVQGWVGADDAPIGFRNLVQHYGPDRVGRWVRTMATIAGYEV